MIAHSIRISRQMSSKRELRKAITTKLLRMDHQEKSRQNSIIKQQLLTHPMVNKAHNICIYNSLTTEPCTMQIIQELHKKEKGVYTPSFRNKKDTHMLSMVNFRGQIIDPKDLEVIICPGRLFTSDGDRLGRGGGHYDRYLAQISPYCYKIGLGFRDQIVASEKIPLDSWDIKMDEVITESPSDENSE